VPAPVDYDDGENWWNYWQGKPKYSEETFVHHKPHMLCSDAKPDRCGGKPAANRMSYGTAYIVYVVTL
jgi:hypothetical protein